MVGRFQLVRTNGRQVEILHGLSLKVAQLQQERDNNAGTRATIMPEPARASGRIPR